MFGGPPYKISAFYHFWVPIYGLFLAKICCNMQLLPPLPSLLYPLSPVTYLNQLGRHRQPLYYHFKSYLKYQDILDTTVFNHVTHARLTEW